MTHERGINDRYPSDGQVLRQGPGAVICISDAVRNNMAAARRGLRQPGDDPQRSRSEGNDAFSTPPMTLRAKHGLDADEPSWA